MSAILTEVDSWVIATFLAGVMLAAWRVGWWRGRRLTQEERDQPTSKFNDAIMALLGLMLAFTFSMSLAKHDQRRQMVVSDSNSIGDFYTCVSLLKEPVRGTLQAVVREYVRQRLALANASRHDPAALEKVLAEIQGMQDQMQALVGEAVEGGTPIAVPLVNTLNEVTSSHAARLAAARDRLPWSIVALLFLAAVLSMALMGKHQALSEQRECTATVGFVLLISMVVWVTLDLNQPHRGVITVSQEPMQRLLSGMGK